MPAVVKYLKKLENPDKHLEESRPSHSINEYDEESNLERYSIQRYDSTSSTDK